jgi:hypothetical protein
MKLHIRHVRAVPLCATGARAWCQRMGVDLRQLCGDGVDLDDHPHLRDDPFVQRVLAMAEQEQGNSHE